MQDVLQTQYAPLLSPPLREDEATRNRAEAIGAAGDMPVGVVATLLLLAKVADPANPLYNLAWASAFLTVLAYELKADLYGAQTTLAGKAAAVKSGLLWNMRRGTPAAVEELLTAYGYPAAVYEGGDPRWILGQNPFHFDVATPPAHLDQYPEPPRYDPDLGPFEFGVVVDGSQAGADLTRVNDLIRMAQNVRSHLVYVRFTQA